MSHASKPTSKKPSLPSDSEAGIKGTADGAEYRVIHRSQLKNAPYNPRFIDPVAAKRLRENLERTKGLVQAPVWNARTGNIVGGHQRLNQIDTIRGTADYTLTVAAVDWDIEQEIEQNIALNNPSLAGQYDLTMLDELLAKDGIDIAHTGFDMTTLEMMHMDAGVDLPDFMLTPEEIDSKEDIEEMVEEIEELSQEAEAQDAEEINEGDIDEIKNRKKEFADRQKFLHHNNVAVRVVFPTAGVRELFAEVLELDLSSEFIDGAKLLETLGHSERMKEVIESEKPEKMRKKPDEPAPETPEQTPKKKPKRKA